MSTDFVRRVGLLIDDVVEELEFTDGGLPLTVPALPFDEFVSSELSNFTSPLNISGALQPNVPAPIAPCAVGKKLV